MTKYFGEWNSWWFYLGLPPGRVFRRNDNEPSNWEWFDWGRRIWLPGYRNTDDFYRELSEEDATAYLMMSDDERTLALSLGMDADNRAQEAAKGAVTKEGLGSSNRAYQDARRRIIEEVAAIDLPFPIRKRSLPSYFF